VSLQITTGTTAHTTELIQLYRRVARSTVDGIIREVEEVDKAYVEGFVCAATQQGLILEATDSDQIVGEIHAYTPSILAFRHLLTELTIVVDPDQQGQGIGSLLLRNFLDRVEANTPYILRVELYTREHNTRNVRFYEGPGFVNEGHQRHKILLPDGQVHTPLHMTWFNPSFLFAGDQAPNY